MTILTPKQSLKKAFLKVKHTVSEIEHFKQKLHNYFNSLDTKQSEENNKNDFRDLLLSTHYSGYSINTEGRIDLALKEKNSSQLQILFEVKRLSNKAEMITDTSVNRKAMQEILYYYLQEFHTNNNTSLKHLIITNCHDVYIFDALVFYSHFGKNQTLKKEFLDFEAKSASGSTTDYFYKEIAPKYVENIDIECTKFSFEDYKNADDTKIVELFKILSPEHLLKLPFANDSNTLNTKFYSELLHIIGLEERPEAKGSSKKIIARKEVGKRNNGSLLENCIHNLLETNELDDVPQLEKYGETEEEIVFSVALELCIVWINRILFLKLLEGQLVAYNNNDPKFRFLNINCFPEFDSLKGLFFGILARQDRSSKYAGFDYIPYLNSSLFEPTPLEQSAIQISNLSDNLKIPILSDTVFKDKSGATIRGEKNTLEYLYEFLDAYDFSSNTTDVLATEKKTLINASVLGLIFEKINGYKDGSFFTPGFITMYMCRETIERAMIQKFADAMKVSFANVTDVANYLSRNNIDLKQANDIFNSITICDPAVGSGHFLVSSLNELIALKYRLNILIDRNGRHISNQAYEFIVENDELIVLDEKRNLFQYNKAHPESQRIQETMFHEKQMLIERCLFGVDINENSVKICRLRLWIELLKYAYYRTDGSGLETLPNLDINIKTGNSLLSRFPIDIDLKEGLRQSTHGIEGYKSAVQLYKKASSKKEKDDCLAIINQCKSEIRLAGEERHPMQVRLNTAVQELHKLNTEISFVEPSPKEKKQKDALEKTIATLSEEISNWKEKKQYANAFEWRFEFPEVLDDDGNFLGFDIIIGNPPYIDIKNLDQFFVDYIFSSYETSSNRVNLFSTFIEKALGLLRKSGYLSFIIPNSLLMNSSYQKLRNLIEENVYEIIKLPEKVFEDAIVETIILGLQKNSNFNDFHLFVSNKQDRIIKIDKVISSKNSWKFYDEPKFNIYINNRIIKPILKVFEKGVILEKLADFSLGITPYDKYKGHSKELIEKKQYHSKEKVSENHKPLIKGENIVQYHVYEDVNEYIEYGNWLGASREERFFTEPRVIVRQIVSGNPPKIYAGFTDKHLYFTQIGFSIIPKSGMSIYELTALLNSKLINFYHKYVFLDIDKELFQKILIENCKQLPCLPFKDSNQIKRLVLDINNAILEKDTLRISELENQIDQLVYRLYELSEEEIAIVEGEGVKGR